MKSLKFRSTDQNIDQQIKTRQIDIEIKINMDRYNIYVL